MIKPIRRNQLNDDEGEVRSVQNPTALVTLQSNYEPFRFIFIGAQFSYNMWLACIKKRRCQLFLFGLGFIRNRRRQLRWKEAKMVPTVAHEHENRLYKGQRHEHIACRTRRIPRSPRILLFCRVLENAFSSRIVLATKANSIPKLSDIRPYCVLVKMVALSTELCCDRSYQDTWNSGSNVLSWYAYHLLRGSSVILEGGQWA